MTTYIKTLIYSFILYSLIIATLYVFAIITWSNPLWITDITSIQFFIFGALFCIASLILKKIRGCSKENTTNIVVKKSFNVVVIALICFIALSFIFILYLSTQGF